MNYNEYPSAHWVIILANKRDKRRILKVEKKMLKDTKVEESESRQVQRQTSIQVWISSYDTDEKYKPI